MKLHLKTGNVLQGKLAIQPLNLVMVFQVNCPGCLLHALPLLERISVKYPALNCFALSTAFEDYYLNTEANTRRLLDESFMTQAPARHFLRLGIKSWPYQINCPVVMDWFVGSDRFERLSTEALSLLDEESMSPELKRRVSTHFKERVASEFRRGRTFMNNDLQGTPSWIIFDDEMQIRQQWFGNKPEEWVIDLIDRELA